MNEQVKQVASKLSILDEVDYAMVRTNEAKSLGIPVSLLDKLVKGGRPQPQRVTADLRDRGGHFDLLGHNNGHYFYFARNKGQVVSFPSSGHTRMSILELAPEFYWFSQYYDPITKDVSIVSIASDLISINHDIGIFDPNNTRGRGAWWNSETESVIFHLGDKVFSDGRYFKPGIVGGCLYENNLSLTGKIDDPLEVSEASTFYKICSKLQWRDPAMAAYIAGYCVVAHIGGALEWRPHVWMNGGAGTGKSWVISKIMRPIFGKNCLFVSGNTSEAFIRQALGNDSIPVLFDEAEGNTEIAVKRIQNVLELARQASSQTGAIQGKGTVSGRPMSFNVRSCFGMASINSTIVQSADSSRITTVELVPDRTGQFSELEQMVCDTIDESYCSAFMSRAISMVPVIRQSAKILSRAVAARYGSQRTGDQLGALLAGTWSLMSDEVITPAEADELVGKNFLEEKKQDDADNDDAAKCYTHLMQSLIDVRLEKGHESMSVGELIDVALARKGQAYLADTQAEDILLRYGMKVEPLGLNISNSHPELKKIYAGTPYAVAWNSVMRRIDGARPTEKTSFGSRELKSRGVFIPHGVV